MRHLPLVGLLLLLTISHAIAQQKSPVSSAELQSLKSLLPLYIRYVRAVQSHDQVEMRNLTTSDFVIQDEKPIRGKQAIKLLVDLLANMNSREYSARVSQWTAKGNYLIAFSEETAQIASKRDGAIEGKMSWKWKQVWRKTPKGWRLASIKRDDGKQKLKDRVVVLTATYPPKQGSE